MKRAPLLLFAGTAAGFISVLGFHLRQAPPTVAGASPSGGASAASPSKAGLTPAGPVAGRSALGPEEQYGYGVLDVEVTESGTRITDVSVPLLQTAEPTSQQISEQAIPMLRAEVLQAQSANVNGISGATFTSQAYLQSLHAALNKLNAQ